MLMLATFTYASMLLRHDALDITLLLRAAVCYDGCHATPAITTLLLRAMPLLALILRRYHGYADAAIWQILRQAPH